MIAPMRISFDLDGVLADMDTALATLAEREFGVSVPKPETEPVRDAGESRSPAAQPDGRPLTGPDGFPTAAVLSSLTARQQTRLWARVAETPNFWETLAEIEPGSIGRLQRLAHDLAWEVLFVTQRPSTAGRTAQVQTQRWLTQRGFEFPAVYTTRASRGRIAAALTLDAHIDDRLDNALDIATESRAWSILVWRDEASFATIQVNAKRMNIAAVRSVGEALTRLEQSARGVRDLSHGRAASEGTAAEGPTIADRLKRAFGFGR
jgi:hypothetical protein